jgi:hypothetical protein
MLFKFFLWIPGGSGGALVADIECRDVRGRQKLVATIVHVHRTLKAGQSVVASKNTITLSEIPDSRAHVARKLLGH